MTLVPVAAGRSIRIAVGIKAQGIGHRAQSAAQIEFILLAEEILKFNEVLVSRCFKVIIILIVAYQILCHAGAEHCKCIEFIVQQRYYTVLFAVERVSW
jgi:hypothetical protein